MTSAGLLWWGVSRIYDVNRLFCVGGSPGFMTSAGFYVFGVSRIYDVSRPFRIGGSQGFMTSAGLFMLEGVQDLWRQQAFLYWRVSRIYDVSRPFCIGGSPGFMTSADLFVLEGVQDLWRQQASTSDHNHFWKCTLSYRRHLVERPSPLPFERKKYCKFHTWRIRLFVILKQWVHALFIIHTKVLDGMVWGLD